jgi:hypothetical protein
MYEVTGLQCTFNDRELMACLLEYFSSIMDIARKLSASKIIWVVICILLGTFNDTLSDGTHTDEM